MHRCCCGGSGGSSAGRVDLPLDGAAVAVAHDQIDSEQYDKLGEISNWLQQAVVS